MKQTGEEGGAEDERGVLARRPEREEGEEAVGVAAAAVARGDVGHGGVARAAGLGARDGALDAAPEADAGREQLLPQRRDELLLRRAVHVAEDRRRRQLLQRLGCRLLQVRAALGEGGGAGTRTHTSTVRVGREHKQQKWWWERDSHSERAAGRGAWRGAGAAARRSGPRDDARR